ncbi:MAG: ferrous iron transport protein B [Verrucomicrobiota bacterium]|nr:ferrous iron transport protein B [Verrucomicrobiota bacterium]
MARVHSGTQAAAQVRYVFITGNPNCGKTTLFNALTGLRAKVGNYAGVTVERKEGPLLGAPRPLPVRVLDLPGTYSLTPHSLDEQIARDVLLGRLPELPPPSVIVVVVDASNLQRNLYYATQVIELGYPTVLALNMIDVAESLGLKIDAEKLAAHLGVPVVPVVASTGAGMPRLRQEIFSLLETPQPPAKARFPLLPEPLVQEAQRLAALITWNFQERRVQADAEALLLLSNEPASASNQTHYPPGIWQAVYTARQRLEGAGVDWRSAVIEARYQAVARIEADVITRLWPPRETWSDRADRVVTHRLWGTLLFLGLMALMFQCIFVFARIPMEALQGAVDALGGWVSRTLPAGDLTSLLVDGVIAGVGAVVVFLPQILLLFLFIGFLEDTGYMARAAFLMDRLMSKVGLHGKSFIPLLSSFACAIPGIMATRTIENHRDRLVTILIAPLMSCSARLPVYTVLIAACIPRQKVLGILELQGLTLLGLYLLGIVAALALAWVFKRTLLKGEPPLLILELPPYRRPVMKVVLHHMWERSKVFLQRAGTVILGINILLWFLASYPRNSEAERSVLEAIESLKALEASSTAIMEFRQEQAPASKPDIGVESIEARLVELESQQQAARLRYSFAGRLGHLIEPLIAPLGFDWRIGIGLITSFAAREVFVSTMSVVYNVGGQTSEEDEVGNLARVMQRQTRPDGSPLYTPLLGMSLMVFYVFALQCASTVAIVRRETNSWRWALFQWCYLALLAWCSSFVVWQGGRLLGWN